MAPLAAAVLAPAVLLALAGVASAQEQPAGEPRLVGTWQAQAGSGEALVITRLTLGADGSFTQQSHGPTTPPLAVWGRYLPVDGGRLQLNIAGWSPQQSCTRQGCTLIRLPTQDFVPYHLVGPSMMQLGQVLFSRMP